MHRHGTHKVPPFRFRREYWSQQALTKHQQSYNQLHETVQQDNLRHFKKLRLRIPDAWHKLYRRCNAHLISTGRYRDKTLQLVLKYWRIDCVIRSYLTSTVTLRTAVITASVNSSSQKGYCNIFALTLDKDICQTKHATTDRPNTSRMNECLSCEFHCHGLSKQYDVTLFYFTWVTLN